MLCEDDDEDDGIDVPKVSARVVVVLTSLALHPRHDIVTFSGDHTAHSISSSSAIVYCWCMLMLSKVGTGVSCLLDLPVGGEFEKV